MKTMNGRFLTATFCDDIRYEVGGKKSFMGCYQGKMIVPYAPITLSKFCIQANAFTPIDRPFTFLTFRVMLDEVELAFLENPLGQVSPLSMLSNVSDEPMTHIFADALIAFVPLAIEKPALLRVIANTEEGDLISQRLLIEIAPNSASPHQKLDS